MVGILMIAAAFAPTAWVLGVWGHRVLTGEYRRLWRPFESALKTGNPPTDIAPAEWSTFLAARRNGHRRALIIQSIALAAILAFAFPLNTPGKLANLAIALFLVGSLTTRLRQINRLTEASNLPARQLP